jgi:CheY-like chemotaxis protein
VKKAGFLQFVRVPHRLISPILTPDAGLRILLAEDNIVNQRLLCRILEKMGHRVVVAEDGSIALRRLADDEFDVIVMDMQMSVMDGIKTTEEIRLQERATGQHIPIMAITANAFDDDRRRCLESGMDGFVVNPVTAQAIQKEMARVLLLPTSTKRKVPVVNTSRQKCVLIRLA